MFADESKFKAELEMAVVGDLCNGALKYWPKKGKKYLGKGDFASVGLVYLHWNNYKLTKQNFIFSRGTLSLLS